MEIGTDFLALGVRVAMVENDRPGPAQCRVFLQGDVSFTHGGMPLESRRKMAEGEGFEPPYALRHNMISSHISVVDHQVLTRTVDILLALFLYLQASSKTHVHTLIKWG